MANASEILLHIKELHLLKYHRTKLTYIQMTSASSQPGKLSFGQSAPALFSSPDDPAGYADTSVSAELVTDVYVNYIEASRKEESERFCRSLLGE